METNTLDRVITPLLSEQLKSKREELGISRNELAKQLSVSTLTLRNWETGAVTKCNYVHARKVERFLEGSLPQPPLALNVPTPIGFYGKIRQVFNLMETHPELQQALLDGLRQEARKALAAYKSELDSPRG